MNRKALLIGGSLAVLGAVAYFVYTRKPKKNSEGFYNMDGNFANASGQSASKSPCRICEGSDGNGYYAQNGNCRRNDSCRQTVKQFSSN